MPPAHPEVPHEAFYDGSVTGVKELFESFEDSLLPIDLQLLKYKKKDLHASHYHRTACRIFSNRKRVLRSHVVDGDPFTCPGKDIHRGKTPFHLPQDEIEQIHDLENDDKSWLEERRKLRKGLNNLGLSTEWLSRKPDRNGVENRVLADLLRKQEPSQPIIQELDCPHNISRIIRLMADHIETFEMLPSIFPNCNRTKRISKANCKDGMLKLQKVLPISPVDIREIVNYFYEETRNSLWKVLVSAVKQSDSIKVGQSVHSVESDWTLSSLDEEEFPQIELKLTEKEKVKATRMKEYESAVQACKECDTVLSEGLLRKVLLHPGDSGSDACSTMQLPQPGNTLSKDFWKVKDAKKRRKKKIRKTSTNRSLVSETDLHSSEYLTQKRKNDEDSDSADSASQESDSSFICNSIDFVDTNSSFFEQSTDSKSNSQSFLSSSSNNCSTNTSTFQSHNENSQISLPFIKKIIPSGKALRKVNNETANRSEMMDASSSSDLASVNRKKGYAKKSLTVNGISGINSVEDGKAKFEKSKISSADTGDSGTTVAKRAPTNVITFPKLRDVSNDRHHVNLSTGRALIGRKVDCWLTFEEYEKLTSSPESTLRREKSIPNSFWPGHLLDKLRLCLTPSDNPTLPKCGAVRSRTTVFQPIQPHNVHRSNYGYNNNERTWPTSGNYVKYGNVDLRKVYHI